MNLGFLSTPILGMPAWVVGIVVIGGVALAIWIRRRGTSSSSSSGALGQNGAAASAPADPNIDPNTGVPYTIESQINPATGLPAYYGTPGLNGDPAQMSAPPAPGPGPSPAPLPAPAPSSAPPKLPPPVPGGTVQPGGRPPAPVTPAAGPRFQVVHAATWPAPDSSLFSIWQQHARGIPFQSWEQQVMGMNPQIKNPDLIYPNEAIKIPA